MLGRRWLLFFAVLGSTASQKEGKKKVGKKKNNSTPPKARALNSHAVGMAVAQLLSFEIDFVRNPISGSAA